MPEEETKFDNIEQGRCIRSWNLPRGPGNGRPRIQDGPASSFSLDVSGTTSRGDEHKEDQDQDLEQGRVEERKGEEEEGEGGWEEGVASAEGGGEGEGKGEGEGEDDEAAQNSERIRVRLGGSIYLWACGETEENGAAALKLPDLLIGWLVLMLQGLAYIMLIARAKDDGSSTTATTSNEGEDSGYSMASVTGAMYLLVASTTPDLRAGFTLLVDGLRYYQRVFGGALLTLYGLMIWAAMKVLFTTSNDDASVVINAVTVLFIADVDEKALSFFTTVPQKWRLFWAIYTVGLSFALALVGIVYVGDPDITDDGSDDVFDHVPGWFNVVVNPGAVTLLSFYLSKAVLMFAEALRSACADAKGDKSVKTWHTVSVMCVSGVKNGLEHTLELMRNTPCFCATLCLWVVHGVVSWRMLLEGTWGSTVTGCTSADSGDETATNSTNISGIVAADITSSSDADGAETDRTVLIVALVFSNLALIMGVSMRFFPARIGRGNRHPETVDTPMKSTVSEEERLASGPSGTCLWLEESYIPPLLVGWGVGYWATSLLLGGSLYESWWDGAAQAATIVGYVVLPFFFVAVAFMIVDDDFLGTKFKPLLKTTGGTLNDKHGVWYWFMATAIRDVLLIWLFMWSFLVPCLNNV